MALAAVLCLSLSTLGYELLLTRWFRLAHGGHLAFLVIGIAMLGTAAGGAFSSHAGSRWTAAARARRSPFPALCLLCAFSVAASFLAVLRLPLDVLRFPFDALQPVYLLAASLLLALPFFFGGLAACTAYAARPEASALIACAGMLGSAAGALLPAAVLPLLGEGGSVAAAAGAALIPPLAFPGARAWVRAAGLALTAGLVALAAAGGGAALAVHPSAYMSLPQILAAPGGRVLSRSTSLLGRVELVESPVLRFAPGLSLAYAGSLPPQRAILVDGDGQTAVYDLGDGTDRAEARQRAAFARCTQPYSAWVLAGQPRSCLVIERDGGLGAACAAASGVEETLVLVENPRAAALLGDAVRLPGLAVRAEGPRTYLARERRSWDLVVVESWGPSVPGLAGLSEDWTLTVDALAACLRRLSATGVLCICRRTVLPPSDSLRVFATVLAALRGEGAARPAEHLAVIRSWDSCSILASRQPLGTGALERLQAFADAWGFDLDWFPGITADRLDRFSRYGSPLFADAYRRLVEDPGFAADYPLDVAPQGDDRPYPSRFLRWLRIREFFRLTGGRRSVLLLSGELVAAAALAEALVACLVVLVPLLAVSRRRAGHAGRVAADSAGGERAGRALLFFASIGAGYMWCEMTFLGALSVLFPGPSVALAVLLAGLLAASGAGGLLSSRMRGRSLSLLCAASAAALAGLTIALPALVRLLLPLPPALRAAGALLVTALPGAVLGVPFPAAMRVLAESDAGRAAAWAVNGCTSVLATSGSALVAVSAGWQVLGLLAAGAYGLAALSLAGRAAWKAAPGQL